MVEGRSYGAGPFQGPDKLSVAPEIPSAPAALGDAGTDRVHFQSTEGAVVNSLGWSGAEPQVVGPTTSASPVRAQEICWQSRDSGNKPFQGLGKIHEIDGTTTGGDGFVAADGKKELVGRIVTG